MARLHPAVFPLIATVSWGTNAVAGRILVGGGYVDGVTLTFARFALATPLIFAGAMLLREKPFSSSRDVVVASILGLFGITGFNVLFYTALGRMEAPLVALITSLITPMTYVLAVLLGLDKLDYRGVSGVLLAIAGTYLVLEPGNNSSLDLMGALMAFGAAVSWTIYTLAVKGVASKMGPTAALAWSSLLGTLALAPVAPNMLSVHYTPLSIALILYVAIVPGAIGYAAWNLGVKLSGPVLPSIFIPLVPLTATILAWTLLGETLTPLQVLGGLLIISGIVLVVTRRA